jgi:4-amino-4-deoxy-L-arabinose transferase-like glycosyltransferase
MDKPAARTFLVGVGVSLATAILMLATERYMAIVWDEGYTLGREARLRDWFRALRDPAAFSATWRPLPADQELVQGTKTPPPLSGQLNTRWQLLTDPNVLAWFWPFAREEPHGHPPFYALLGLAGDVLAPSSWADLHRARLGPILLFSLTAGVIYVFAAARWGIWPAALTAAAWDLQPNLFGHGHYAAYDAVLTCLWVLSIVLFAKSVDPVGGEQSQKLWGWTALFGVVLGCAAATKLTGWFLPLPFLAWSLVYRSRRGLLTLLVGLAVGLVVLFALLPPWWSAPITGVFRFWNSNTTRPETINIQVQFLGVVYNTPTQSLPWYNTLVWTLLVTPVGFLTFAELGLWACLRNWRSEPVGILIGGHWAFLMLLRALPNTPGHDGVRLFLPAFGVLALLSGRGARRLLERLARWGRAAVVASVLEGLVSVAVMMPVPNSYFSPLVGGLPGATALGMEPTYYWDALNPEARAWLTARTGPGETIVFRGFPTSWLYLRRTGELPRRLARVDAGRPAWIVIQNRPGAFSNEDRVLVAHGRPAFTVTKLGVPLLWIYPTSELQRVVPGRP